MTQTNNRFLDDVAKLMTDAAGAAQGMRREVEGVVKSQLQKVLADMDVVRRDEFEAVKAMAEKARGENERLSSRLAELEQRLAAAVGPRPARREARSRTSRPRPLLRWRSRVALDPGISTGCSTSSTAASEIARFFALPPCPATLLVEKD